MIQSIYNNLTLGVKWFDDGKNGTFTFGLYDQPNDHANIDERLLFKIEPFIYRFKVAIASVEFNKNFQDIVEASKKQVDLIETEVIDNNSPATLVHEVDSEKEFAESLSTTFESSQTFIDSFSKSATVSDRSTDER